MGSVGANKLTRTQKLVNRITREIQTWIDDSFLEEDDFESIRDWHDLLEGLNMTASEAREAIIDSLEGDIWDKILSHKTLTDDERELTFNDGEFEDENGNFIKYGDIMKLVKKELVNKNILKVGR